jgi:hypothetical protein
MHYSRVNVPEKALMEYGVYYGYPDEFAYPFDGIVKPVIRLAEHPHLVAFRDHIPDEQYSNYGC